ncbi:polymer-forming cytoskeletal protein [bacterium]|nr:polymer-forming cytoskeletal protein [bacterium]
MNSTGKDAKLDTIIGKETIITGNVKTKGSLRIDGEFEGNITVSDTFTAGSSARVKGDVRCKDAFVGGRIEGNVYSHGKVEMHSGANLTGDVTCKGLVIQDNVFFEGRCSMKEKEETKK